MDPEKKSNGALIGSIIIIIILIIGGIYLWKTGKKAPLDTNMENSEESLDLEADLNSIDLESLDAEI